MKVIVSGENPLKVKTGALVFFAHKDFKMSKEIAEVNKKLNGEIAKAQKEKVFEGDFKQIRIISTLGALPAEKIALVGVGRENEFSQERLRRAIAAVSKRLRDLGARDIAIVADDMESTVSATEGAMLGLYELSKYKTMEKEKMRIESITLLTKNPKAAKNAVETTAEVCKSVNYVRDMVNGPAGEVNAEFIAREAEKLGRDNGFKAKVLGKHECEKMGMNAFLGVNRGSHNEPKFIVLEYAGRGRKVALVGKGIIFDSGGLDLKSADGMQDMKNDKAGALTVLGIVATAARLKLPVHLYGVMPCTENLPGGTAQKPGDIVKAYNGKTIEVVNTDAEGRLVLSDALAYAEKELKPEVIIDLATLTGACVTALGYFAAGMVGSNQKLMEELYIRAVKLILPDKKTTAFYLQRKLWIDLPRAKQILRMLVKNGVVS